MHADLFPCISIPTCTFRTRYFDESIQPTDIAHLSSNTFSFRSTPARTRAWTWTRASDRVAFVIFACRCMSFFGRVLDSIECALYSMSETSLLPSDLSVTLITYKLEKIGSIFVAMASDSTNCTRIRITWADQTFSRNSKSNKIVSLSTNRVWIGVAGSHDFFITWSRLHNFNILHIVGAS